MTERSEPDFHPVVKLLIARMESNPEEFDGRGLWRSRVDIYDDAYTEVEVDALQSAERDIALGRKHAVVMESLLSPPEEAGLRAGSAAANIKQRPAADLQQRSLANAQYNATLNGPTPGVSAVFGNLFK